MEDDFEYEQGASYGGADYGFGDFMEPDPDHETHEEYMERVWSDGYDQNQDYLNFLIDAGLMPEDSTVEDMIDGGYSLI